MSRSPNEQLPPLDTARLRRDTDGCRSTPHRCLRRCLLFVLALVLGVARPLAAQQLLVPMDDDQRNHLKAYGLMYGALKDGLKGEWLLNFRGGAFLLPDVQSVRRRAAGGR